MPEKSHSDCIKLLQESQRTDHDNREMVREADLFLNKRDGQWEPEIVQQWSGKPRYTFDECNPIVDDIMGEMLQMDFDIRVSPSGGDSSKDTAKSYEGIIRNIENISGARFIYNSAARIMVGTGFAAWRVVQVYRDSDSFQQDLLIQSVPNAQDMVWFDPGATEQDMSDAQFCHVLTSLTRKEYEEAYPKGSGMSVGQEIREQAYSYKKSDEVVIGEYLYRKKKSRELALMSNSSVYVIDDDFEKIIDELAMGGVTIISTRKRDYYQVYHKLFDGADWLSDDKPTVFEYVPIVPVYGNFRISENKVIYWGAVEKLMDAQRIINYAESRKIEEGAFAPRGKHWMTKDQAKSPSVKRTLRTLNTNADPVQFYDHAPDQPPPAFQGAPASNPGLMETTASAQQFIQRSSGTFDEARGEAPAGRSGKAVDLLQQKSDNPKRKWFTSMEIPLRHTCRICIKAIPKVYDTKQEMRLVNQDGTTDTITLRDVVWDEQTRRMVEINDLSKGSYDVTCSAGPAFHSRQQEAVTAIYELAEIDPTIPQIGSDVLLNNIQAPGIELIAERKRMQMLQQGLIPESQLTDEEKAMMQQQSQQQNQPSPIDQANLMIAQAELQDVQGKNEERAVKLQLEQQKLQLKQMELSMKAQSEESKMALQATTEMINAIKTQAETLKTIKEAMGVDAIMSPVTARAYEGQAQDLNESIRKQ